MNDKELDELIMQAVERQQTLETLNRAIVKDVRKRARRTWLRQWGRIVVFSFGLPLLMLIFAAGTYYIASLEGFGYLRLVLVLPVATMIYMAYRSSKNFSIKEV